MGKGDPWDPRSSLARLSRLVGTGWRRVFTLAIIPLALGTSLLLVSDSGVVNDLGTGFIGGSVLGFVFAVAQFTLDQQTADRQERSDLNLVLVSTPDLIGIDLSGRDLSSSYMRGKTLTRANLDGACLVAANLAECVLDEATLRGARLTEANLRGANLRGAVLDGANLTEAHLNDAQLEGASLVGANLSRATMTCLAGPGDGAPADWRGADLSRGILDRARLDGAFLANSQASFVSAYRVEAQGVVLRGSDLSCADLRAANLHGADLRDVDLSGADLTGAEMTNAQLGGARLVGACLVGANLTGTTIEGSDMRAADLRDAHLTNIDLSSIDQTDALAPGSSVVASDHDHDVNPLLVAADPHGGPGDAPFAPLPPRLVVVADDSSLHQLVDDVVAVLRRRREALLAVNRRLAKVEPLDDIPHFGDVVDHGLPEDVSDARSVRPRLHTAVATLDPDGSGVRIRLTATPARGRPPRLRSATAAAQPTAVASRIQLLLGADRAFLDPADMAAVGSWLDRDDPERQAVVSADDAARNPLALVVRAWCRESSDLAQMELAIDETRIAWAATRSPLVRTLASARLGWAQAQIGHRSVVSSIQMARAKSAADWALQRLEGLLESRPDSSELKVLKLKSLIARRLAYTVDEDYEELIRGMELIDDVVAFSVQHGLPISKAAVNNLSYNLMARAGRFTRGGAHDDYVGAAAGFSSILETYSGAEPGGVGELVAAVRARHDGDKKADPDHAPDRVVRLALVNLGNLCRLYRRYDDAIACYDAAVHIHPNYREAYTERAWVHLDRGHPDLADADIELMLTCDGGTPGQVARNLANYADALGRVGRWPYQRSWLVEALERDPGNQRVRDLLDGWERRANMPEKKTETEATAGSEHARTTIPAVTWPAPRLRPDTYPGPAPDYSYLLVGDEVQRLEARFTGDVLRITLEDGTLLDEELDRLGVARLGERIPAIGYGANRSPHSLGLKFVHHGTDPDKRSDVVPVLAGSLGDVDAVAAGITSQGFIYADLADSPGTRIDVMLALLDPDQLVAIHDSEHVGRMYDCAWLPGFTVAGTDGALAGMGYLGRRPYFQLPDGKAEPLAFSIIEAHGRTFASSSQVEMMARIIEVTDAAPKLAKLFDLKESPKPTAIAHDLIRLLNGQWWYRHNTGDEPMQMAVDAEEIVSEAMRRHPGKRADASPLNTTILSPEEAYTPAPKYTLKAQVDLP